MPGAADRLFANPHEQLAAEQFCCQSRSGHSAPPKRQHCPKGHELGDATRKHHYQQESSLNAASKTEVTPDAHQQGARGLRYRLVIKGLCLQIAPKISCNADVTTEEAATSSCVVHKTSSHTRGRCPSRTENRSWQFIDSRPATHRPSKMQHTYLQEGRKRHLIRELMAKPADQSRIWSPLTYAPEPLCRTK